MPAKHLRPRSTTKSAISAGVSGVLAFAVGLAYVGSGLGWLQALAWFLGLAASPIASAMTAFGVTLRLDAEDGRRAFEAQFKLSVVNGVGYALSLIIIRTGVPAAAAGAGVVAASLVAVASWTLLAEIIAIAIWHKLPAQGT